MASDAAWGRSSNAAFEEQIKKAQKQSKRAKLPGESREASRADLRKQPVP